MDVKRYMTQEPKSLTEAAMPRIDRLYKLIEGLEKTRETVSSIPEENTSEALEAAYKAIERAFIAGISAEQLGIQEEVEK